MRKVLLLALLVSPVALAQSVSVETNSLMRLPSSTSVLQLERLEVAAYGTLLTPATISQVTLAELHLGRDARTAMVPGNTALQLHAGNAQLDHGSQITSRGAPGTHEKPAKAGRDLTLRINSLSAEELSVDARGGAGNRLSCRCGCVAGRGHPAYPGAVPGQPKQPDRHLSGAG